MGHNSTQNNTSMNQLTITKNLYKIVSWKSAIPKVRFCSNTSASENQHIIITFDTLNISYKCGYIK